MSKNQFVNELQILVKETKRLALDISDYYRDMLKDFKKISEDEFNAMRDEIVSLYQK